MSASFSPLATTTVTTATSKLGDALVIATNAPATTAEIGTAVHGIGTGATKVAVACPFCLQMFDDGLRSRDPAGGIRAADLAELVAERLSGSAPK